jgi:hypothetical protein
MRVAYPFISKRRALRGKRRWRARAALFRKQASWPNQKNFESIRSRWICGLRFGRAVAYSQRVCFWPVILARGGVGRFPGGRTRRLCLPRSKDARPTPFVRRVGARGRGRLGRRAKWTCPPPGTPIGATAATPGEPDTHHMDPPARRHRQRNQLARSFGKGRGTSRRLGPGHLRLHQ